MNEHSLLCRLSENEEGIWKWYKGRNCSGHGHQQMGALCLGELGVRTLWHSDWVVITIESVTHIHTGFNSRFITFFTELNTRHKSLVIWNINDGYEVMTVIISRISQFPLQLFNTPPPPLGKIIQIFIASSEIFIILRYKNFHMICIHCWSKQELVRENKNGVYTGNIMSDHLKFSWFLAWLCAHYFNCLF